MPESELTRGERTQAQIRTAAYRLFLEKGFHGASMRAIARQAGIAVAGIYNHYPSKDDIFYAVLLEHHPYFRVAPALQQARGSTIEEFVQDSARRMVAALGDDPEFIKLMFIEIVEFNGAHYPKILEKIFPELLRLVEEKARSNRKIRDIPTPILLRVFIGLFFSFYMTELMFGQRYGAEQQPGALRYFIDIYLHGILTSEA
jgi:AcrR family transcriptional regulator